MKTKEEFKQWVKDHERQIKTGAKIALGAVVVIVIGKKLTAPKTIVQDAIETTAKAVPEVIPEEVKTKCRELPLELIKQKFEVYSEGPRWLEFADYGEGIGMTIEEAHRAINAISKIDGFTDESRIQAMFNVCALDE